MGCQASKQASLGGENRPQELAKCAAVSEDVRWAWLRGRTLFTFAEIRALWQAFVKTATSELPLEQLGTSAPPKAPICSVEGKGKGKGPCAAGPAKTVLMDKAQFLSFCDASDKFRVSEAVGAFASRLFDVLDDDGDGYLNFETFALGLSKLLKGPESEKLKLMYAAYDLSGVAPSEERRKSSETSGNGSSRTLSGIGNGGNATGTGGRAKPSRRSKYLSLQDMTAVLASASQVAVYPTLLSFTTDGGGGGAITTSYLSSSGGLNGCCGGGGESKSASEEEPPRDGGIKPSSSQDSMSSGSTRSGGSGGGRRRGNSDGGGGGSSGGGSASSSASSSARTSRDPEALAQLLREIARRNAAEYAARAVSEFGQAHSGALTQKEFERWALTGPVLRCRINEFSIDLDLAPFQGVRLA